MTARALRAGPGAGRALRSGGRGAVELALGSGGYVRLGGHRILVAGPRAPLGPLSLLVCGLPPAALRPGWPAAVERARGAAAVERAGGGATLVLGPLHIGLAGAREAPAARAGSCRPGWRRALYAALAACPAPPAGLHHGLVAVAEGRTERAVRALAGRGDGLTPAGDDVLAGWAAWRWADAASAGASARGLRTLAGGLCAPLGLAYLACAERGELPEPAAQVLEAVRTGDRHAARRRARALAAWGSSSGSALLWGMAAAAGLRPGARDLAPAPHGWSPANTVRSRARAA